MKMKKKLIKKVNILNRTIHINFYSNYILYNYLNNYNLKYYFLFNSRRKNYFKLVNNFKLIFTKNSNLNLNLKTNFNLVKSNMYINNGRDKFFKTLPQDSNHYYFKNYKFTQTQKEKGNFIILLNNNILINNSILYNSIILYKELMVAIFLLNLSKIFEIYKIVILLTFFKLT